VGKRYGRRAAPVLAGVDLQVAPGEAASLVERLGFSAWLDGRLAHDSSGTLHKVLLAQALAGAPPLLVLTSRGRASTRTPARRSCSASTAPARWPPTAR
jgi:hypothetical protein